MPALSVIGCGFVADLYMRSLQQFPEIQVIGVYDINQERAKSFAAHWGLRAFDDLASLLTETPKDAVVLNLTNPKSHYEINMACLDAGHHVYSEKPLAMTMADASAVVGKAKEKGLLLASAPCSVLGEAAQTLAHAVRTGAIGTPKLVYAELDDGYISQAPHENWRSESGAIWPAEDEFQTGCTLEHAGYYLTWLIAMFGAVKSVTAASAELDPDKVTDGAPDFSTGVLFFENGMAARLTCSVIAPHDHQIRIIGDAGVASVKKAWDNSAKVVVHKRMTVRRRLMESPIGKRHKLRGPTHPKVGRWGAASMNFALGPVEMLDALREDRPCRLSTDFALHLNEVTLAIQNAGNNTGAQIMQTRCDPMEPMPWAT